MRRKGFPKGGNQAVRGGRQNTSYSENEPPSKEGATQQK